MNFTEPLNWFYFIEKENEKNMEKMISRWVKFHSGCVLCVHAKIYGEMWVLIRCDKIIIIENAHDLYK